MANYGLTAKAIIVMGIVTFAKQLPNIFSEATGIKSGNLKLGIKEKLAEGGAFTFGAIAGAGATTFLKGAVSEGKSLYNNWGELKKAKASGDKAKIKEARTKLLTSGAGFLPSLATHTLKSQGQALMKGTNLKSYGDMKKLAGQTSQETLDKWDYNKRYKASHGGTIIGAGAHKVADAVTNASSWLGISTSGESNISYYQMAAKEADSFNSSSEAFYKQKQEWIDLNAKVKELKAEKAIEGAAFTKTAELDKAEKMLRQMQIDAVRKKQDALSLIATNLVNNQREKYSNDANLTAAYQRALADAWREYNTDMAKLGKTISAQDTNLYNQLMNMDAVIDTRNITDEGSYFLQQFIDNVNINRKRQVTDLEKAASRRKANQMANNQNNNGGN